MYKITLYNQPVRGNSLNLVSLCSRNWQKKSWYNNFPENYFLFSVNFWKLIPESVAMICLNVCKELPHITVQTHIIRFVHGMHLWIFMYDVCNYQNIQKIILTFFISLVTSFLKVIWIVSDWTPSLVPDPLKENMSMSIVYSSYK